MFFILKSRYRKEKIELLGKIEKLRRKSECMGQEKVSLTNEIEKKEEENKILKQKLKARNMELREVKEKLSDIDKRLKDKVDEKTKGYEEKMKRMQSSYDKLVFELDDYRNR